MIDDFKVIIDGVSLEFFDDASSSIEWIVDAYRNTDDFTIIDNPSQKRTLDLSSDELNKEQFRKLASVIGKVNICHTVQLYDDITQTLKTYPMYNSTLKYKKRKKAGEVKYLSVSFSLIER